MRSLTPSPSHRPLARSRWTRGFAHQFPSWLRERGEEYFASGKVVLDDASDRHVRAVVLGTEPYVVELRRHSNAVALSCGCAYFQRDAGPCKHLWAVLLAAEKDGVQLMKPMPALAALLDKAKAKGIFGTKMRSVIKQAHAAGIKDIVSQQFDVAGQISAAGLVPIIEPEVDIHCPEKAKAEAVLKAAILEKLNELPAGQFVMIKLTLPERDDFYADCVRHPKVLRVVGLSGGFIRQEANERLRRNHGMAASFSRALVEGLSAQQSDTEFNALLDASIQSTFEASNT